jgi:hypothetical protein
LADFVPNSPTKNAYQNVLSTTTPKTFQQLAGQLRELQKWVETE